MLFAPVVAAVVLLLSSEFFLFLYQSPCVFYLYILYQLEPFELVHTAVLLRYGLLFSIMSYHRGYFLFTQQC